MSRANRRCPANISISVWRNVVLTEKKMIPQGEEKKVKQMFQWFLI